MTEGHCTSQPLGKPDLEDPTPVFPGFTVIQLNRPVKSSMSIGTGRFHSEVLRAVSVTDMCLYPITSSFFIRW